MNYVRERKRGTLRPNTSLENRTLRKKTGPLPSNGFRKPLNKGFPKLNWNSLGHIASLA